MTISSGHNHQAPPVPAAIEARVSKLGTNSAAVWLACPPGAPEDALRRAAADATTAALKGAGRSLEGPPREWSARPAIRAAEPDSTGRVRARLVLKFRW